MTKQSSDHDAMTKFVLPLDEINGTMLSIVGGKAANLGEMIQSQNIPVPPGFCVTADGYRSFLRLANRRRGVKGEQPTIDDLLGQLDKINPQDYEAVCAAGEGIRTFLEQVPMPKEVSKSVAAAYEELEVGGGKTVRVGEEGHVCSKGKRITAVAVRSSATAEDLPGASFAGQQDTYLNVRGVQSVLENVKKCWISLFTDRAISYRAINGFDHMKVDLCVVVQKQIDPVSSGVLFTADPLTGRRLTTFIEATWGLGEALVSGLVNTDKYKIDRKSGILFERDIGDKRIEIVPSLCGEHMDGGEGGTDTIELTGTRRTDPVLAQSQIDNLVKLGDKVLDHYGHGMPQDIEWCFERDTDRLYLVQARPITTLFPIPGASERDVTGGAASKEQEEDDLSTHVYVSFGHQQVMTAPMLPCSRSIWRFMAPFSRDEKTGKANDLKEAGCHLFLDATDALRMPKFARSAFLKFSTNMDARVAASLTEVVSKNDSWFTGRRPSKGYRKALFGFLWVAKNMFSKILWRVFFARGLEHYPADTLSYMDECVKSMREKVRSESDPSLRLKASLDELKGAFKHVFKIMPSALAGIASASLLPRVVGNDADAKENLELLGRGLQGNVTTDMDLVIGDLSDLARSEPAIEGWLKAGENLSLEGLDALIEAEGAAQKSRFRASLSDFLLRYGCRGGSEIDISCPRWSDDPSPIFQVIRGNLSGEGVGTHRKHHEALAKEGEAAAKRIVASAPFWKRPLVRRLVYASRNLMAMREHHKFLIIQVVAEVRECVLLEAKGLVMSGHLATKDEVWLLTIDELPDAPSWSVERCRSLVAERRAEHERYSKMKPPRVITGEGECVNVQPDRGYAPPGALIGTAASAGVVEGIAKVVMDPRHAVLHAGELLVAPFTDPGWTPLFINSAGLVMEVGGVMTHGSVVAREYGIPAVIGVDDATTKIKDGDRIRINGDSGYVEIIPEE